MDSACQPYMNSDWTNSNIFLFLTHSLHVLRLVNTVRFDTLFSLTLLLFSLSLCVSGWREKHAFPSLILSLSLSLSLYLCLLHFKSDWSVVLAVTRVFEIFDSHTRVRWGLLYIKDDISPQYKCAQPFLCLFW